MNNNFRIFFKRAAAYLIDIVIVFVLGTVISCLPIFNKDHKAYQEVYNEFNDFLEKNDEFRNKIKDDYKDGIINQEEYDKLILFDQYNNLIIDKYDDKEINNEEYQKILDDVDKINDEKIEFYNYKLKKLSISNTLITLGCMLGYFGFLQYFLKGKTVGKLVLKLRIVSISGKRVGLLLLIVRSLIVNNIFINLLNLGCLWLFKMNTYNEIVSILDMIISVVEAVIIYLIITREDGRGLHDLITKTKVIYDDKVKNKDAKVLDGEYIEK